MVDERTGGNPEALASAKAAIQHLARDHSRTPMQWNNTANGGFSQATPWMRVNDDYSTCNVKQQKMDKNSVLSFWKNMLVLRKQFADLFVYGDFLLLDEADEKRFCFVKQWNNEKALVVLNFTAEEQEWRLPASLGSQKAEMVVSTADAAKTNSLTGYEGRVYLIH
jgi:alpha-glucosidase